MNFMDHIRQHYMVISANQEAYWTCFAFDNVDPTDLHCTHKYLGEQPEINVQQIVDILDMHFEDNPFEQITPVFNKEEIFGEEKDTRVLTKDNEAYPNEMFLLELRNLLDVFSSDKFPEYKPHVTTDADKIELPFTRYCLMQGDKIIKEY